MGRGGECLRSTLGATPLGEVLTRSALSNASMDSMPKSMTLFSASVYSTGGRFLDLR
jgi:hypothetical protein